MIIALIESDEGIGASVYRGFQHHFVTWVAQLGPPLIVNLYRFRQTDESVHERAHLLSAESACEAVLRAMADSLIFQGERYTQKQCALALVQKAQERRGSARRTSESRDHHVGIEYDSQPRK